MVWYAFTCPRLTPLSVLATLLPTAFFAALDRGTNAPGTTTEAAAEAAFTLVSDETRAQILHISRGLAVILLVMYDSISSFGSRGY